MASQTVPSARRKAQPKPQLATYIKLYNPLITSAARRGYSSRALEALFLAAVAAHAARGKAVRRG